ncbi:IS110 family RNA-guided transposase [Sporosarcina obsidiansis]|uniref:IS110 family transposase n=1 Tax=Sporosarcina obsidiansis TaxID=2660748 RepID=UPI00272B1789|nr:IS110 family transposase [Sporosarcina obsidiansis]
MKHVVAFDVSMGKSTMVIYNRHRQCEFEGEILHNRPSFEQLHATLQQLKTKDEQAPEIVFEATGVYSKGLEKFLQDHQYTYCCLNPIQANEETKTMRRQKTDKADAHGLARTHFRNERAHTYVEEDYYGQMRAWSRYYNELDTEINHLHNRMHAILQLSFPELETVFSTRSALFLNIVQLYPHPDEVLDHSRTIIRNRLKQNTKKNLSLQRAEAKGQCLMEAARLSYPAISRNDIRCEQVRDYARRIRDLKEKKEQLIKQMVTLSEEKVEYQVLMSYPGIGETTAVRIIGELGDIRRFKTHKQVNAYVGIDLRVYQSGKHQMKDIINRRGNRHLRKILFFMVKTMITLRRKTKNHLVEYYDKLKTQPQGKPHKVACVACMNKFLKLAFHLITHGKTYDYEIATNYS